MITYEPKPFLDAAPVNALTHKNPRYAFQLVSYLTKQYFKAGNLVKEFAKLSCPHKYNSLATHSRINAVGLSNIYIVHKPMDSVGCTFSYSPTNSMAGGVSNGDGGKQAWRGYSPVGGKPYYYWPGVKVRASMYPLLGFAQYYNTLSKSPTLTQGVKVLNYTYKDIDCSTRQPVQQSAMIDNAIIVRSRPMSPHAKAYKAIQSGAEVYVKVDGEFVAIGKIQQVCYCSTRTTVKLTEGK